MTIKKLADDLGVDKEKIKYLWRQLPENWSHKSGNKYLLSDAAVDAIRRKLDGGELTSDIPVPEFDENTRIGWGIPPISPEIISEFTDSTGENTDNSPFHQFTGESIGEKNQVEESVKNDAAFLTIIDHYRAVVASQAEQLAAKDEQMQKFTEFASSAMTDLTEQLKAKDDQLTAAQTAHADQLAAKDTQIQRMQDTVDALTRQLADAAERERQLQETIEQSREEPRKWWMWWKR